MKKMISIYCQRFLISMLCLFSFTAVMLAANYSMEEGKEGTEKSETKWEFYLLLEESETSSMGSDYLFGDRAHQLKEKIQDVYVTREEVVPGDPMTRIVIRKPSIYQSVNLLEKYLRKEIKGQRISVEEASKLFLQVEQIALAAIGTDDTESFEDELNKSKKKPDQLLSLFEQVKLIHL